MIPACAMGRAAAYMYLQLARARNCGSIGVWEIPTQHHPPLKNRCVPLSHAPYTSHLSPSGAESDPAGPTTSVRHSPSVAATYHTCWIAKRPLLTRKSPKNFGTSHCPDSASRSDEAFFHVSTSGWAGASGLTLSFVNHFQMVVRAGKEH